MKYAITALAAGFAFAAPAMACGASKSAEKTMPAKYETKATKDIVATAEAAGFTTLLAAAIAADLVDALKGDGPLTVFAPTNEAFAKLGDETIATLLKPENKDQLAAILKYHVIAGKVKSKDLAGKTTEAETLNGTVTVNGMDGVMVNNAKVITADVKASNGIIHVIDTVLIPAE